MLWVLWVIIALIILFIAIIVIRTLRFKPHKGLPVQENEEVFDRERAIENLRELVRCKTVSYKDHSLEDDAEFNKFVGMLPELYPAVFKTCEFMQLPDRALLFKWKGSEDGNPAVMMAHYDVVPVEEEF